jgi:hypothetical protein
MIQSSSNKRDPRQLALERLLRPQTRAAPLPHSLLPNCHPWSRPTALRRCIVDNNTPTCVPLLVRHPLVAPVR